MLATALVALYGLAMLCVNSYVGRTAHRWEAEIKSGDTLLLMILVLWQVELPVVVGPALLFSALGDYFLSKRKSLRDEQRRELYFIFGLGSYLVGYLVYGIAFLLVGNAAAPAAYAGLGLFAAAGVLQYLTMDREKLRGMEIPLLAYLVQATLLMYGAAAFLADRGVGITSLMLFAGSFSIYLSDSFIGHHLFRRNLKHSELYITPTYILGHLLIVLGLM